MAKKKAYKKVKKIAQEGLTMPRQQDYPDVESYHAALDAYNVSLTDMYAVQEMQLTPGIKPNSNPLQTSTSRFQQVMQQAPSTLESFQNRNMSKPTAIGQPMGKKKFNWGKAAVTALAITNAVLPEDPIKKPVVRPANSYNPHPYGTNSQALAEEGITLSKTGYKRNSKDRNKPSLRIPSGDITMNNVPHPVLGVDSFGNQQIMMPNENYQFPGEYVDEFPLAKKGKKLKKPKMGQYISKSYEDGGELEEYQQGGRTPIAVTNPNDPRLRAYNDSLVLYNSSNKVREKFKNSSNPFKYQFEAEDFGKSILNSVENIEASKAYKNLNNPKPEKIYNTTVGNIEQTYATYKKPVQPVVYQKPQQAAPIKKGQPTYEDSLKLYNKYPPKKGQPDHRNFVKGKDIADFYGSESWKLYEKQETRSGIKPIGSNMFLSGDFGQPVFKKPVGTPQPQEPKFKRTISPVGQAPNLQVGEGRPTPIAPNLQQANYDVTKPTKFAFTYPDYNQQGIDNQQKSMYFPDLQSLRSFGRGYGLEPQYGADESWGQILAQNTPENLRKMKKGGKMKYANNGLQIENNAYTPISDSVLQINGDSHQNGGTDLFFNGQGVEAEAGETFHIDQEGNGIIAGNMRNPLTGKKFKQDSKMLAKKEKKVDKLLDYSTELVTKSNPFDKWESLKFNSGEAMMIGAHMKKQELQQSREHLTALQEAMLELKNEDEEISLLENGGRKGAKNGLKINPTEKAQWGYNMRFRTSSSSSTSTSTRRNHRRPAPEELPIVDPNTPTTTTTNTTGSVAQRHNNPGNMKYEKWMAKFGAVPGQSDNITKDGTTYAQFPDMQSGMSAMREKLFNRPTFSKLDLKTAINKWTGGHPYANIPNDLAGKTLAQMTPEEKERAFSVITMGEDSKVYNRVDPGSSTTQPVAAMEKQTYVPQDINFSPVKSPTFGPSAPNTPTPQSRQPYNYNWNLQETPDIPVPTDAEGLQFTQILPEIYAAATNKQEPVWMQQYNPQLYQDFEVSLQDRRNRVTSQGRASRQYLGDNAGAQAILAAQEYDAIGNVDAEEFRINQQISNDITNKNISLLNDAQTTNLKLADQQYTRQALGKSKTKAANQTILNSLSNKVLQNQLENRTLQVYENLYPHFRYDENYKLQKEGNPGSDYLSTAGLNPQSNPFDNTSTQKTFGPTGGLKQIKTTTPGAMELALKKLKLEDAKNKNLQKLFNLDK